MSTETSKPRVIVIDDEPDKQIALKLALQNQADVTILYPNDIFEGDLLNPDLVLIDYSLEEWKEKEGIELISTRPTDGLALAAVIRSFLNSTEKESPTAFALHSGKLTDLSDELPPSNREHAIARVNNLEWVFQKATANKGFTLSQQIVSLAESVSRLPKAWPSADVEKMQELVCDLLQLDMDSEKAWIIEAWEDIEKCHPPIHELSKSSHGLAFLRWLLHKILPYPCFLRDTHWLAARFRVSHQWLTDVLVHENSLSERLFSCQYKGILSGFMGNRWWRAGVEAFIWEATNANPFAMDVFHAALSEITGSTPTPIHVTQPVVCVDENYKALDEPLDMEDAVRIQPDDWPPYADDAWTPLEFARANPLLRSLVVTRDRDRL